MFAPFTTDLMDINVSLPLTCSYTFNFSKSFKPNKVEEVSSFVNGVYSKCLSASVSYNNETKVGDEQIEVKLALSSSICSSIPSRCTFNFEYSEDNFLDRADEAASFVSDIFSKFPNLSSEERTQLYKKGRVEISQTNFEKVTDLQISTFKKALKDRIVKDLTDDLEVDLGTDNYPEGALRDVAQAVFNRTALAWYFPTKTSTCIKVLKTNIEVRMQLSF